LRAITIRIKTKERACVKVLSFKGIRWFEGEKDALTLILSATYLDMETRRVSVVVV
jgi:hypothetical protein